MTFTTPIQLLNSFPANYQIPQLLSYNLIVEREVLPSWVLRLGYHGTKATHLATGALGSRSDVRDLNPAIYIPGASTVANTQSRRPNPNFSNIYIQDASNISTYNSLQVNLEKRWSQGLSLLVNHTWSKMLDDLGWSNPYNRRADYGPSVNDVPHAFRASGAWQLPGRLGGPAGWLLNDWSLNAIVSWQSSFPISVVSGRDNSFTGQNRDRADYIGGGDPNLGSSRPHGEMVAQYFDTSKFTVNLPGTFGNSGKGIIRLPRNFNTDASLFRNIRIKERATLQFRAEFFNVFNNVNFINLRGGGIVNNVSSNQFGRLTTAADPRIMQFALKLLF